MHSMREKRLTAYLVYAITLFPLAPRLLPAAMVTAQGYDEEKGEEGGEGGNVITMHTMA